MTVAFANPAYSKLGLAPIMLEFVSLIKPIFGRQK